MNRRATRAGVAVLMTLSVLVAGCVSGGVPAAVPTPTATVTHGDFDGKPGRPPPFLVRYDGVELQLAAVTFCTVGPTSGVCADGSDPNPPSIGSPAEFFVYVPMAGLDELVVTLSDVTPVDSPGVNAQTKSLGGGWWSVRPAGPSGERAVVISATSSHGGGDMIAEVRWQVP